MRLSHFLPIFITSTLPLHALTEPAEPPAEASAIIPAQTMTKLINFLDFFIDPDKSAAEQAALFTHNADYYGRGPVSRQEIAKDSNYADRRWPWRFYRLLSIDYITRDPAPGTDRVFVVYRIEFEVANPSSTIVGVASYAATIVNLSGSPQVEAISEKIVKRKRYAGSCHICPPTHVER